MTKKFWIAALATALGVATFSLAQGPAPRHRFVGGPAGHPAVVGLNLKP